MRDPASYSKLELAQAFLMAIDGVPMVYYGAARVDPLRIPAVEEAIFDNFPTVTVMNLADVMARIPPSTYSVQCVIGDDPPVTLEFIVVDYLRHLNHHVAQIRERLSAIST